MVETRRRAGGHEHPPDTGEKERVRINSAHGSNGERQANGKRVSVVNMEVEKWLAVDPSKRWSEVLYLCYRSEKCNNNNNNEAGSIVMSFLRCI